VVAQLVEALSHEILYFSVDLILPDPMTLGSAQPLTEMSTKNLPGGKGRPAGA
jgi:hypothetical protein